MEILDKGTKFKGKVLDFDGEVVEDTTLPENDSKSDTLITDNTLDMFAELEKFMAGQLD